MAQYKSDHENPRISVIMAVRNGERYLREAIESILVQTFENFEFIIINDFSTDSSLGIINSYKDKRIRCLANSTHLGLTPSLNMAIRIARAPYIARMDGDDISEPSRLQLSWDYMESHPEVTVLGTNAHFINEDGKTLGQSVQIDNKILPWLQIWGNKIIHSSVMFRRNNVVKMGGYNEEFVRSQDYDLWCRLIMAGYKISLLSEQLIRYRCSPHQVTNLQRENQENAAKKILKNYLNWLSEEKITCSQFENYWKLTRNEGGLIKKDLQEAIAVLKAVLKSKYASQNRRIIHKIEMAFSKELLRYAEYLSSIKDKLAGEVTLLALRFAPEVLVSLDAIKQCCRVLMKIIY